MNYGKILTLVVAFAILALVVIGCASPTPVTVKETVTVPQTVVVPQTVTVKETVVAPQTVIVQATVPPTAAPLKAVEGTLTSVMTKVAPMLDGNGNDAVWASAPASEIAVRTFGTPAFKITLKSVYDAENVYFLVSYPDSNMDVDRSEWAFDPVKKTWARIEDDFGDEDEFGFFWNINIPDYPKTGCLATCHGDTMVAPKGQSTDDWRWNSSRTNPMGWVRDFRLTDDEKADPSGGFAKDEGYKNNYVDNTQKLGAVDVPLYWKPFSGAGGIVVGDPRYLLQSEIDAKLAKKIAKVEADGTLVDEAGNKVPFFAHIPGRILSAPGGPSWNDIKGKGTWANGAWTVELGRKLNTGHKDDVQFEVGKDYYFDMYIKTRQPGESAHAQVPLTKFVFAK